MNEQATRVLNAIRAKGCQTFGHGDDSLRHAVHESVHGIRLSVPVWENEKIHRACVKVRRGDRLSEELIARAVEQVVCARLDVPCGTVEHFAFITCMESLKNGLDIGKISLIATGVQRLMTDTKIVAPLVDQIIAMGDDVTT